MIGRIIALAVGLGLAGALAIPFAANASMAHRSRPVTVTGTQQAEITAVITAALAAMAVVAVLVAVTGLARHGARRPQ
jgi:hypothetical protein